MTAYQVIAACVCAWVFGVFVGSYLRLFSPALKGSYLGELSRQFGVRPEHLYYLGVGLLETAQELNRKGYRILAYNEEENKAVDVDQTIATAIEGYKRKVPGARL